MADRWFLHDVEGELRIWPEADLRDVDRDKQGEIISWREPAKFEPIAEWRLDTWDPLIDGDDDKVRAIAQCIVREHNHAHEQEAGHLAESARLRADLEASERGGAQLGMTITFLTEVMAGTALLGADDAIGTLRDLVPVLAEADAINRDQAAQIHAGLDSQQATRQRLTELRADQAQSAGQVQRVRDLAGWFREREKDLMRRHDKATCDDQQTSFLSAAALTGDAAQRLENALDGGEGDG